MDTEVPLQKVSCLELKYGGQKCKLLFCTDFCKNFSFQEAAKIVHRAQTDIDLVGKDNEVRLPTTESRELLLQSD